MPTSTLIIIITLIITLTLTLTRLVVMDPFEGDTDVSNTGFMGGNIVVAGRGKVTFVSKALKGRLLSYLLKIYLFTYSVGYLVVQ